MTDINYTWKLYRDSIARIYYSTTPFDSTTLPTTFQEYPFSDGVNLFTQTIPYRTKQFSMFELETADGSKYYGELINSSALEDVIVTTSVNKRLVRVNTNFDVLQIKEIEGWRFYKGTYDPTTKQLYYVIYRDDASGDAGFVCLDANTLDVIWKKDSLRSTNNPSLYTKYHIDYYQDKTDVLLKDGVVYFNVSNGVYMVNVDGSDYTSSEFAGFTKMLDDGGEVVSFDITDSGSHMYITGGANRFVSKQPSDGTGKFNDAYLDSGTVEKVVSIDATSTTPGKLYCLNGSDTEILILFYDTDLNSRLRSAQTYNIDTETFTDKTSSYFQIQHVNSVKSFVGKSIKKNGKLYLHQTEESSAGWIAADTFSIFDLTDHSTIGYTVLNGVSFSNIQWIKQMNVYADEQTFVACPGEVGLFTVFDPVDDQLFNALAAYAVHRNPDNGKIVTYAVRDPIPLS